MPGILYVNGDSHSYGYDAGGKDYAYGKYVADALGYDYVCDAVSACSNDSIIDRTLKYFDSQTPDLIIIGWSTWERETWYWQNQTYHVTASGFDTVHPQLQDRYKKWVINNCDPEYQQFKELQNHSKIYHFHQFLSNHNIKHLFFNCYNHFFYTAEYNKSKFDWANSYIDPYDENFTYYYWLKNMGYKPANPKFYHYGTDAHQAWANFILPKVQMLLTANE